MAGLDSFDLSGKVAVVTGGTRGIGRAISFAYAEAGADVVPTSRTPEAVEATVDGVRDRGADSISRPTDVTDEAAVRELFERVGTALGGVDLVVNNAGVNPRDALGKPTTVSDEGWEVTLDVNLRAPFVCARAAGPALRDAAGVLINVSSVGGLVGLPRQHPYVASKHGIVGLTRSLAIDWAPDVRVNAITPGYVSTDLTEEIEANERLKQSILDRTPMARFADPDEIAGPAVFLASAAASFVTGSVLVVDGGWTAK